MKITKLTLTNKELNLLVDGLYQRFNFEVNPKSLASKLMDKLFDALRDTDTKSESSFTLLSPPKFKIGDTIDYYDSMDEWTGKVRGIGDVSNREDNITHKVYFIEGKFKEDKEINWFEYPVQYADEDGQLINN